MKKYNVKEIVIQAHEIRKAQGVTMGAALKMSWGVAKLTVGANPMDDTVQEYFKRLEAADKAMKALEEIKAVTSNRLDSKEFKAAGYADLYKQYSHPQTSRCFLCKPVAVPA